ncbi:uncharacterized protein NEMAJ01_0447 [Nematocida major]|uniref:uncharacterized protein n=1 Tax=Nematocida major TaxID=1912982 RepID=UPI002007C6FF|nr:uncharacterized protein NEMAJ01_0447 [Nematocida major]KAH9385551.1 hypothetical protein NEMAJ01_0447 [Nematocida major]
MERSSTKKIVTALEGCAPSQEHLHRIPAEDMPFVCMICKEVLLKKKVQSHLCEPQEKKTELEESAFFNTHCGVLDAETGVNCTRSLNCKVHSVLMKRAVCKRTQSFDALLKKSMEEKKKRKIEREDEKAEKKEKILDGCIKLEEQICAKLLSHVPVVEKTFYLPEIKFDTLAVRSLFFQPLKICRAQQERRGRPGRP